MSILKVLKHIYSHRTIAKELAKFERKSFQKTTTKSFRAIKEKKKKTMEKGGGVKKEKNKN